MRKIALLTLLSGLTLALSGCLILVDPPVYNFRFNSNWQRTSDSAYVFCTNQDTYIRYSFNVPDPDRIQSIEEIYAGIISERILVVPRPKTDLNYLNGRYTFSGKLTFGQTGIPQNLQPFSIVVSPFPPTTRDINPPPASKNGETQVTVKVVSTTGVTYRGYYTYDTYANCP